MLQIPSFTGNSLISQLEPIQTTQVSGQEATQTSTQVSVQEVDQKVTEVAPQVIIQTEHQAKDQEGFFQRVFKKLKEVLKCIFCCFKKKAEKNAELKKELAAVEKTFGEDIEPQTTISHLNTIGLAAFTQNDFERADVYFKQARKYVEETRGEVESIIFSLGVGSSFIGKDNKKACNFLKYALKLSKKNYGEGSQEVAKTLILIGTAYVKEHNFNKARSYYYKALSISKNLNDRNMELAEIYANIGGTWITTNTEKAIKYYQKAHDIASSINPPDTQSLEYYSHALDELKKKLESPVTVN